MSEKSIRFVLPSLPASANILHRPEFRGGRMVGMRLTDDVNRWQQNILQQGYIPRFDIAKNAVLKLEMDFHFDWSKRRFDVTNLWKATQDVIAKRLGFNDKGVREWHGKAVHDVDREQVIVTLTQALID